MNELTTLNDEQTPFADDYFLLIAEMAEKRVEIINKIKRIALKSTNSNDWIDINGKPYLNVSGAEKISRVFGISWRIDEPQYEQEEDGHFTYTYKGYFSLGGMTIEAIGARSSKDGFFKKYQYVNGEKVELPISAIDKADVKKAAYTNCIGNGITKLLGIRNLSWDDLAEAGIKPSVKIEYTQQPEDHNITRKKEEIMQMLSEMHNSDKEKIKLALKNFSSFRSKQGFIEGKEDINKLTPKAVEVVYEKVKKTYDEFIKKITNEAPAEDTFQEPF